MKQTAMQNLKEDLILTKLNIKDALLEIQNDKINQACIEVVNLTLNRIIKRIDDELLEMERQQITDAHSDGKKRQIENSKLYYCETFKSE
jgi:hypothetical protein